MECELPERPHTVGALPKPYANSDAVLKLLKQIHEEAKGPIEKPKPQQKNYLKENLRRLREIEAKSKVRINEKQTLQPLRVPNRYSQTQSKIRIEQENFSSKDVRCNDPPKTAGPLRSRNLCSPCFDTKSDEHNHLKSYRSLPRLDRTENTNQVDQKKEFQHEKRQPNQTIQKKGSEPRHQLGKIPNYLSERKKQWEQERERQLKLMEEASVPSGYTLLPDEERVETLELLKKNEEELIRTLSTLPVRNDTTRLRNHREELERQLAKVEEGIKIFSRPKVLIKNDT